MRLEQMNLEILEGCRATTGMSTTDFAAAFGLARGAIPKHASGGTTLEVIPANSQSKTPVRVYAMAKDGKFILGLRRDFELLGLQFGRFCDALDKSYDKRITG